MRKIRIVSDGTGPHTKIIDAETGEDLRIPFAEAQWKIDDSGFAYVTLVMAGVECDLLGDLRTLSTEP